MISGCFKRFVFLAALLFSVVVHAMPDSKGNEFVFAFQNNYQSGGELLVFVTSERDTQGLVEVPGLEVSPGVTFSEPFSVVANQTTTITLPRGAQRLAVNGSAPLGVHLTADDEVTVYGVNLQRFTSDAFLALPLDVLSNEYIAMSYDGLDQFQLPSQLAVVATADNTIVQITPTADVGGNPADQPFSVVLDRFEVYQLNTNTEDLTGTTIRSSDPIAVMGGHVCADVPSILRSPTGGRIGWCDHLSEMMTPLNTWGQSFAVIPLATRLNGSIVRVLAAENGTVVNTNGINSQPVTLDRGEFVETVLTDFTEISATGPVMVAQYSPGQAFDNVQSDPFMMLIPPNEQFLSSYSFATPEDSFDTHFVNVAIPTLAIDSLLLDGSPVDSNLFSLIGGSGLSGAQLPVSEGSHTLSADQPFGIYIYGFNNFDSYGYPGGLALAETNPLGDSFSPNIGAFRQVGRTLLGTASDSEDVNANGILDAGEDINNNGLQDRRTEDVNGNGVLDASEDTNANGVLDRDRGVFKIELLPGATNLVLQVTEFVAGQSPLINFRIDLVDQNVDGTGRVRVEDLNGNSAEVDVVVSSVAVLADVEVISTVSGDRVAVDQNTFSHPPLSVDVQAANTVVEWRFPSLRADQVETIGFDVVLDDPQPQEQRLVTQKVELSYINAPGGARITTELGSQSVLVANTEFALQASTNTSEYGPQENAVLQAQVTNVGTANNSGTIQFTIEDSNGAVVETLAPSDFGPLLAGGSVVVTGTWNTTTSIAGIYQLRAVLRDSDGRITNESVSAFSVVNSTSGVPAASLEITVGESIEGGNLFVEKLVYHTSDSVQIQGRITNESSNTLLSNTALQITVLSPSGASVFTQDIPITGQLVPGAFTDAVASFVLDDAEEGNYQVQATYIDVGSSRTIATQNGQFNVAQNIALSVTGQVSARFAQLLADDTQTCTDTINSLIAAPLTGLPVQMAVVNISNQQEVRSTQSLIDLPGGESVTSGRSESTSGLASGDYACLLRVDTGSELQTLGFAPFTLFRVIADAGSNLNGLVDQTVTLDGSGTRVSTGEILSLQWRIISSPAGSTTSLLNATTSQPSFVPDEQGEYVIELVASTATEDSVPSQVVVTVPNRAPQASAGADQTLVVGLTAQLDGSASSDLDNDPLTYQWTVTQQPAGSSNSISNTTSANPTLLMAAEGVYVVELVVNDGFVNSVADRVELTASTGLPVIGGVTAQADELLLGDVQVCTDTVTSRVSQPLTGIFVQRGVLDVNAQQDVRSVDGSLDLAVDQSITTDRDEPTSNLAAGRYACVLRVDGNTGTGLQDVGLAAFDVFNLIAVPGSDQTALVGETVTLDGSGSREASGLPLNYEWRFVSVPASSTATLSDSTVVAPSFFVDEQGEYVIELVVNNGLEDSRPKQVRVTVANRLAVANAGPDQAVNAGTTAFLDGSGSIDLDGDTLQFDWSIVQRPDGSTSELSDTTALNPTLPIDIAGVYRVQLIVNDGFADSVPDTVLLNVGNVPPVADAGIDLVAQINDLITLDGSASNDANGDQIGFVWFFESIPAGSSATLLNTATPRPFFTTDLAGDYVAKLIVNDGLASSAADSVTVTVGNVAPVADAGPDQSGFVGDLITIDGTGSRDANNDALSYRWNMTSRPDGSNAQLIGSSGPAPTFVLDVAGDYIIQLIVNDGTEDSLPDTVITTVGNRRPVANAQRNNSSDLFTGDTVSLSSNGSFDPDGDPITYEWSFIDRPAGSTTLFDDNTSSTPSFQVDLPGDYIAQLTVHDGQLRSTPDTVFVEGAQHCVNNLAIRPKFNKIALTWDHNPDVESVEIQRANSLDGPYEVVANSTSTYATYLDSGLEYGLVYYYRIRGLFPLDNAPLQCNHFGDGIVICGETQCQIRFTEEGLQLQCPDREACEISDFDFSPGPITAQCGVVHDSQAANSCPDTPRLARSFVNREVDGGFCQEVCGLYAEAPEDAQNEFPEFDFGLCLPPVTERRSCQTQIIASEPVGRVRVVRVPDVIGMGEEQARQTIEQNRLTLGTISFERTTAVPAGQVIRQDVPRDSVMAPNTAIDIVISTQGAPSGQ